MSVHVQFEDPTDDLQKLRQSVELKRARALPWLVNLSCGAIASVAAQHSHTHSSTGTVSGHPANENSNGHSNGCVIAGETFQDFVPAFTDVKNAVGALHLVSVACQTGKHGLWQAQKPKNGIQQTTSHLTGVLQVTQMRHRSRWRLGLR